MPSAFTSAFSTGIMRLVPSVVSLDETPNPIGALGAEYIHVPSGSARVKARRKRMNTGALGGTSSVARFDAETDYRRLVRVVKEQATAGR